MTYFTRLLYNYTSKIEHKVKVIAWANWNSQSQKNYKGRSLKRVIGRVSFSFLRLFY